MLVIAGFDKINEIAAVTRKVQITIEIVEKINPSLAVIAILYFPRERRARIIEMPPNINTGKIIPNEKKERMLKTKAAIESPLVSAVFFSLNISVSIKTVYHLKMIFHMLIARLEANNGYKEIENGFKMMYTD